MQIGCKNTNKIFLVILLAGILLTGCFSDNVSNTPSSNSKDFKRASFLPKKARTLLNKGINKIESGNVTGAIADFQNTTRAYPDCAIAYYNLGLAYTKNDDMNKAVNSWEQAILVDQNYADAYYNLGLAYKMLHNNKKAQENFTNYIRLKPDDGNTDSIRQEIIQLQEVDTGKGIIGRIAITDRTNLKNDLAVEPKNLFRPQTPYIYTSIEVVNAPANTDMQVVWYYLTSDNQKLPVNLLKFKVKGTKNLLLTLKRPKGHWPTGKYQTDIFVNHDLNSIVTFNVLD